MTPPFHSVFRGVMQATLIYHLHPFISVLQCKHFAFLHKKVNYLSYGRKLSFSNPTVLDAYVVVLECNGRSKLLSRPGPTVDANPFIIMY